MARASIKLTVGLLRDLLNLPAEYEVHAVYVPDVERGDVLLLVDAPDVPAGDLSQRAIERVTAPRMHVCCIKRHPDLDGQVWQRVWVEPAG